MFKNGVVFINLKDLIALAILGAAVVAFLVMLVIAFVQNKLKDRNKHKSSSDSRNTK